MRRTLLLDENDLIMVVKEDVVKQIDENRGELNRTEFVNYLILTIFLYIQRIYNIVEYVIRQNKTNKINEVSLDGI